MADSGAAAPPQDGRPAGPVAIVTCMDPRVQLGQLAGVDVGHAFVLRNAGGRVTDDVIRSLVLCTRMLAVAEIGVLHHTDCRLQGRTNAELAAATGVEIDFLPFGDQGAAVSLDVRRLLTCGVLPAGTRVWGGLYDVADHTVAPLDPARPVQLQDQGQPG